MGDIIGGMAIGVIEPILAPHLKNLVSEIFIFLTGFSYDNHNRWNGHWSD